MIQKEIVIKNKTGLHLRPASVLSKIASTCKSDIIIEKDNKKINVKSVLNLMAAQINMGDTVTIVVDGENEEEDMKKIVEAIESGLGE